MCIRDSYYGFQPGDSYWMVLVPMAFVMKIPFAVPILAGLCAGPIVVIPVSCGVVVYYILNYVRQNAGLLTNDASVDIAQKFVQIIQAILSNKAIVVMIAVCAVGVLAVYLIRTLSVDYAWMIAKMCIRDRLLTGKKNQSESELMEKALAAGVRVYGLSSYFIHPEHNHRPATMVLGLSLIHI